MRKRRYSKPERPLVGRGTQAAAGLFLLASAMLLPASAAAQPPDDGNSLHSVALLPPGAPEGAENPVTVSFRGFVYGDGAWLSQRREAGVAPTPAEAFLTEALKTYREGTLADVLELWLPEDRPGVQKLFTDPEIFEQNQSFYRRLADSALVARVLYGPSYVLLFVQHTGSGFEDFVKVYPLVEDGGRYYLTNRLQADPVFVYFSTAYKDSLPLREKPQPRDENGGAQNASAGS